MDQICTKRYFWSKTEKVNIIIEFRIFKLVSWYQISALNDDFDFFWPDLHKKGFSGLKQKKWRPHIFYIILHIHISLVQNFSSNWQFWFFGPNLSKKVFPVENIILNIHIGLVRNFSSTDNFDFLDQICTEKCFHSKAEKVNITMEFSIFELA